MIDSFHFLRPTMLLLAIPAAVVLVSLWRQRSGNSAWEKIIDAQLLPHLLQGFNAKQALWPLVALACALLIAIVALAGPAWQRLPQALSQSEDALIIVFDLSLSMRATDVQPSRVQRAQLKLRDILSQRKEGLTALVVYAGDAHTVSPFTDDVNTIAAMLPALQPEIMPKLGNRTDAAIGLATQLIKDANLQRATILLVCDEIQEKQLAGVSKHLNNALSLSIMSVGTNEGGPVPLPQGGFLRDGAGEIIVPKTDQQQLKRLASQLGARYHPMSQDSSDFEYLLPTQFDRQENNRMINNEADDADLREFDLWRDEGAYLALLLLPFGLLAFRRGWFLALALVAIMPEPAQAFEWQDLWQRKDQQASKALQDGDAKKAAELFNNKNWKASAQYKAGDYEAAAELFDSNSAYNKGNALARAGKLKEAITAYDEALAQPTSSEDAKYNKAIIEELLKQQQKQDQQNKDDNSEGQENQDQQNQDKQSQDPDNSENQEGSENQQNSDSQQGSENQDNKQEQDSAKEQSDEEQQAQQEAQEQNTEEQKAKEQAAQEAKEQQEQQQQEQQAGQQGTSREDQEREQELQQWLRKVPDDPGGLLRNKFKHQYEQNRRRQEYYDDSGQIW